MRGRLFLLVVLQIFTGLLGGSMMDIRFDKAYYKPGDSMLLSITGLNRVVRYDLRLSKDIRQTHAATGIVSPDKPVISVLLPLQKGAYGLDITFEDGETISRGISVMDDWLESPRYGFLTEFHPERIDIEIIMDYLVQYHINGLQYYDWMYDYGKLVYEEGALYKDAWQRIKDISVETLRELIISGHERNIHSMAYVALYAVARELGEKHPDWLLYEKKDGNWKIVDFYEKLVLADNRSSSGWTDFLVNECRKTIELGFDGIHLDQYGYPTDNAASTLDDGKYRPYKTSEAFVQFFDYLKSKIDQRPVFFNYVNNWPNEIQEEARLDAVYIEPWESCNTYQDLHDMIVDARMRSGGKHAILAAYIRGTSESSILLANSVIAVSRGRRLEIGEYMKVLSGPYFPDADTASDSLLKSLRDYYDFKVRYEAFIEGEFMDSKTLILGAPSNDLPSIDSVWLTAKKSDAGIMINLVNFIDIRSDLWRNRQRRPRTLTDLELSIPVEWIPEGAALHYASPDGQLKAQEMTVYRDEGSCKVILSSLKYWSAVFLNWPEK